MLREGRVNASLPVKTSPPVRLLTVIALTQAVSGEYPYCSFCSAHSIDHGIIALDLLPLPQSDLEVISLMFRDLSVAMFFHLPEVSEASAAVAIQPSPAQGKQQQNICDQATSGSETPRHRMHKCA